MDGAGNNALPWVSIINWHGNECLMLEDEEGLGLVQVYTGDGKGKTTAALGLGLRAAGHGYRVLMVQFMKGKINYGELEGVKNISGFDIVQFGRPDFVDKQNPDPIDIKLAQDGLAHARSVIENRGCDILILDELNVAVDFGLVSIDDVLALVDSKPDDMELIITGRYAHERLLDRADLVSEVHEGKHPFSKGKMARKGIEF